MGDFAFCNNDGNIIHVFKNCISIPVATVLEVSKMTAPICTSHWCLVMSFWLKVCIYSYTRGVKLGLGLGFMQTSQVLPHWLNQSIFFLNLALCTEALYKILNKYIMHIFLNIILWSFLMQCLQVIYLFFVHCHSFIIVNRIILDM